MTVNGFSLANLEKSAGSTAAAPSGRSRGGRMLVAALVLVLLAVQLTLSMKAFPSPVWALGAFAVGLPATIFIIRKPEFGILVTTALIPLESLASRQNDPLSLFKVLGVLTLVAFIISWAFQAKYPGLVRVRQNRQILVVGGVLLFTALFSRSHEMSVTSLRRYATLFIYYFLVVNLVRTRRLARATAWLVMVPIALSAAVAVASYGMGQNLFPGETNNREMLRTVGTSRDANFFAATVLVGLPFYIYYFRLEKRKLLKIFLGGCFLVTLLSVIYSFSRGGAIALAVMTAAMVGAERMRLSRRSLVAIVAGLVIVGAIVIPLIPGSYTERLASFKNWKEDDSLARRSLYVVFGADILLHRPFTGCGPGAFQYMMDTDYEKRFPMRLRSEGSRQVKRGRAAHNMYLEIAAEMGLPGILAFGWLFFFTFRELRRLVRSARERGPPEFYALARSTEVAYWGFLTTSLFLSAEYRKPLWLLIALTAVLRVLEESPSGFGAERARAALPERAVTARSGR